MREIVVLQNSFHYLKKDRIVCEVIVVNMKKLNFWHAYFFLECSKNFFSFHACVICGNLEERWKNLVRIWPCCSMLINFCELQKSFQRPLHEKFHYLGLQNRQHLYQFDQLFRGFNYINIKNDTSSNVFRPFFKHFDHSFE